MPRINSSFTRQFITQQLDRLKTASEDVQPILHVTCAHCGRVGSLTCGRCRLAKYCCKDHQTANWPNHKKECKSPYSSDSWQPSWKTENRKAAYVVGNDGPPAVVFGKHGYTSYVWGNVPAIDCLQIERNEGVDVAISQDIKLCFAASGDIRNMIVTVNSLPNNYKGRCDILLNDLNPTVTNRNLVILVSLLRSNSSLEDAAEIATHLMYSAALPPAIAYQFWKSIETIYGREGWENEFLFKGNFPTRGKGKLLLWQRREDVENTLNMFLSNINSLDASKSMKDIMMNPARVDYLDRYLASLHPYHRLAFLHYRNSGILAPFSANTAHFTEANRLMFSPDGKWLTLDNANPLHGWHLADVKVSGRKHGISDADIYGCLFFHVKDQLKEFARRVQNFHINIQITSLNCVHIADAITNWGAFELFDKKATFDRIESSNAADYVGLPAILDKLAPLLNTKNRHSTLLVYLMNWQLKHRKPLISFSSNSRTAALMSAKEHLPPDADFDRILNNLEIFLDDWEDFNKFIGTAAQMESRRNITHRTTNRIHTKRYGIPLEQQNTTPIPKMSKEDFYDLYTIGAGDACVRFLEFENCSEPSKSSTKTKRNS